MTIVIGVASTSGVALGADSRTSLSFPTANGGLVTRPVTNFADKVAVLNQAAVCGTFGLAAVGGRLMQHHMRAFSGLLGEHEPLDVVCPKLVDYFENLYEVALADGMPAVPADGVCFGFIVGGRNGDGTFAVSTVVTPGKRVQTSMAQMGNPGARWHGNVYPLSRLIMGVDPRIPFTDQQSATAAGYGYRLSLGESLQEMVDFTLFGLRLTVDTDRFTNGMHIEPNGLDICGEPFDVAVVTDESSAWASRKQLSVR